MKKKFKYDHDVRFKLNEFHILFVPYVVYYSFYKYFKITLYVLLNQSQHI